VRRSACAFAEERHPVERDHRLADPLHVPLGARDGGDRTEGEEADRPPASVDHGIRREATRRRDLVHEATDGDVLIDHDGIPHHEIADVQPRERLVGRDVPRLGGRRLEQEPPDEREPRPAERPLDDEHENAEPDEQVAETPADVGRHSRCPPEIASRPPERCTQHAAPVQRQRRGEVEREHGQVDVAEPGGGAVERAREARERKHHERNPKSERDERARDRDSKLGARARERPFELRDTAEQPQRDAVDLDPLASRLPRMAQLVKKQRGKEEERGDDGEGEGEVRTLGEDRVLGWEHARRERPDDQREDDQPAPIDPDLNAAEAAECEVSVHGTRSSLVRRRRSMRS
jgi:hypothetical protein